MAALGLQTVLLLWGTRVWLGVERFQLCLQDTSCSAKQHRRAAVGNWVSVCVKCCRMVNSVPRWTLFPNQLANIVRPSDDCRLWYCLRGGNINMYNVNSWKAGPWLENLFLKSSVIGDKVQKADLTIRNLLRLCCVDQTGTSIQILPEPCDALFINYDFKIPI